MGHRKIKTAVVFREKKCIFLMQKNGPRKVPFKAFAFLKIGKFYHEIGNAGVESGYKKKCLA